jgi:hypothetical protein
LKCLRDSVDSIFNWLSPRKNDEKKEMELTQGFQTCGTMEPFNLAILEKERTI